MFSTSMAATPHITLLEILTSTPEVSTHEITSPEIWTSTPDTSEAFEGTTEFLSSEQPSLSVTLFSQETTSSQIWTLTSK
ncbi:unnamed protein product, partial [Didymodactylos carnosus]